MKRPVWRAAMASAAVFAAAAAATAASAHAAGAGPTAGPASAPDTAETGGVHCRIAVSHARGMLRLDAIGRVPAATTGRYRFSISKSNAAGSTANTQSGEVALPAGQDHVLATVMLEAAAEGHYTARLTLDANAGQAECSAP